MLDGRSLLNRRSTHDGEDQITRCPRELRRTLPDLCTIIAPRHPERGGAIAEMLKERGFSVARRSLGHLPDRTSDAYVADTIGELGMLYKLGPVAFIGGSLVDRGGQNPIEAVRQGAVVLVGPHWQNFADAYRALISNRGAVEVHSAEEIARVVRQLLSDEEELRSMRSRAVAALATISGARRARWETCALPPERRLVACFSDEPPGGMPETRAWWPRRCSRWARSMAGPRRLRYLRTEPYRSRWAVICIGNSRRRHR